MNYKQELKQGIQKLYNSFYNWIKPKTEDPWWVAFPKFIAKLPVVLLVIAFSPVLFILIFILFLIAI